MEGVSQEAITLAGRQELSKLIVFWDNNSITIDGKVDLADATNQVDRFKSSGWHVLEINGHDPIQIDHAIIEAKKSNKPTMIACKTHIALGSSAQDTSKGHGALTDKSLIEETKKSLRMEPRRVFCSNRSKGRMGKNWQKGPREEIVLGKSFFSNISKEAI
jgi:transketolase